MRRSVFVAEINCFPSEFRCCFPLFLNVPLLMPFSVLECFACYLRALPCFLQCEFTNCCVASFLIRKFAYCMLA